MQSECAGIILDVAAKNMDRVLTYLVPGELSARLVLGSKVSVPLGPRKISGYVVSLGGSPPRDIALRAIGGLLEDEPLFTEAQLELARWMADNYLCSTVTALHTVMGPAGRGTGPRIKNGVFTKLTEGDAPVIQLTPKQLLVLEAAASMPGLSPAELARQAGVNPGVVNTLIKKGILVSRSQEVRRSPFYPAEQNSGHWHILNEYQSRAVHQIKDSLSRGEVKVYLLHGITGSGKTEVYLQGIKEALGRSLQCLVLVPEISLTPQMVSIFKARFGDKVAVLHSRLGAGERFDEWQRIKRGLAPVVLGARSAIFAPLERPGLIILDEEHEASYKNEENPRYHARDIALKLAGKYGAVTVLGSATPSLESYSRSAPGGPYSLLEILERPGKRPLPAVKIIDLREEYKGGNRGSLSRELVSALGQRLEKKELSIIFLNRRGYSTFIACRECGVVMKCPHCDISLTYHSGGLLRCHYCNYFSRDTGACRDCGSKHLGYMGTGTQKLEEELVQHFPGARVLRMDSDSTTRKGSHGRILEAFRSGEADILVGTQMVAKGLDIPGVTLVGIINPDLTLNMPDFRASEKTFQLVAQVSGRAGRGDAKGQVLLQTMSPGHYAIRMAAAGDYGAFYQREMEIRHALRYPPFVRLARVILTSALEEKIKIAGEQMAELLKKCSVAGQDFELLGPSPAPLGRVKDRFRYHIILKSRGAAPLRRWLPEALGQVSARFNGKEICFAVDIDPQNLM